MAIHNDIQLRTATLADIDSIMKIESAGFIAQIQEAQTVFEKRIKVCPSLFLVFEDKASGMIVGYLSAEYMSHVPESATQLTLGHEPCAVVSSIIYISSFSILPEYRGNGTGSFLWNKALEYFESLGTANTFLLLVNEAWCGAKHIYKKSGFEVIDIFENFFPTEGKNTTAGILMKKNL